jgi:hypothetical protein
MAASILTRIGAALESAFDEKRDDAKLDAAHDDIRRDLRDLGALVKTRRGMTRAQARMVRLLSRLQQDSMFVGRVAGLSRSSACEYAHALHGICRDVADAMLDPEGHAFDRCREGLAAAAAAFAAARRESAYAPARGDLAHASAESERGGDALDFLLETLGKDLHDLIRVLQAPR